ncbi:hypothetical protein P171DRAFT_483882 [Karstenula rhodostoma CBS 690.94]|uniref:F-box domain-containing protein n=1 Tax=Karstenula rhodostoma CBS 690.94 TaxID=1392251 RepID=A0A9P4PM92_9PLEO|nr:hypothetical protein P171DRAFT_483882 [Karstenula rhodostoma CBS 690.94]
MVKGTPQLPPFIFAWNLSKGAKYALAIPGSCLERQPVARLSSLPNEILNQILGHFDCKDEQGRRVLVRVSQVCKALRPVARQHLCRQVMIDLDQPMDVERAFCLSENINKNEFASHLTIIVSEASRKLKSPLDFQQWITSISPSRNLTLSFPSEFCRIHSQEDCYCRRLSPCGLPPDDFDVLLELVCSTPNVKATHLPPVTVPSNATMAFKGQITIHTDGEEFTVKFTPQTPSEWVALLLYAKSDTSTYDFSISESYFQSWETFLRDNQINEKTWNISLRLNKSNMRYPFCPNYSFDDCIGLGMLQRLHIKDSIWIAEFQLYLRGRVPNLQSFDMYEMFSGHGRIPLEKVAGWPLLKSVSFAYPKISEGQLAREEEYVSYRYVAEPDKEDYKAEETLGYARAWSPWCDASQLAIWP